MKKNIEKSVVNGILTILLFSQVQQCIQKMQMYFFQNRITHLLFYITLLKYSA